MGSQTKFKTIEIESFSEILVINGFGIAKLYHFLSIKPSIFYYFEVVRPHFKSRVQVRNSLIIISFKLDNFRHQLLYLFFVKLYDLFSILKVTYKKIFLAIDQIYHFIYFCWKLVHSNIDS